MRMVGDLDEVADVPIDPDRSSSRGWEAIREGLVRMEVELVE